MRPPPPAVERRRAAAARPFGWRSVLATIVLFGVAALVVVGGSEARTEFVSAPFRTLSIPADIRAGASPAAFGKSGGVKMRVALPAATLEFPLAVSGDPSALRYQWVRLEDQAPVDSVRPLAGARVKVPAAPGFYRLALMRGGAGREVLPEPTVGVLVPFERKLGGKLNGYRIGTYLAERLGKGDGGGDQSRPAGFLEVGAAEATLKVSEHLTLADFITHDDQGDVWPKYVAISPQLLDKLELVIAEVRRWRPAAGAPSLSFGVHSGFRAPAHNKTVRRAARDSRHQYGDAADVVMDADGDGRITALDGRLVALAVEMVELKNPELAGGLGLYTSGRYRTPYVHIDARGRKTRWRG